MPNTIEILQRCRLFRDLDLTILKMVAAAAEYRDFGAHSVLFATGDTRDFFYVVIEGDLEVQIESGDAEGTIVVLGPGEGVGEAGLLEAGLHSASARAVSDVSVLEINNQALRGALLEDAQAAMTLFAAVSRVMVRRLQYSAFRRAGWDRIYAEGSTRREHDLLGERDLPADAKYGIQTLRAIENFPITGIHLAHFPQFIRALAMVKQAAAHANHKLGLLTDEVKDAIDQACHEIIDGHWHGHFVVDMVQGGAGTSTNMNANEVIANRALELLGRQRGEYSHCHPNNHINLSQSTNDAYPTAIRVATILKQQELSDGLLELSKALHSKAEEFKDVLKMGRTQLQDAVPMTLGQEFEAFAVTTLEDILRLKEATQLLHEINLGGTAIGTGINADPLYPELAVAALREISGLDLSLAENLVEATPDTGAFVAFSGSLKRIAIKLSKMCNDLRLLSSGPRCGFNEINLPPMQPGSSIMPGKVNPVIPEVVNQVAYQVIGNDLTITMASEAGQLQLNVMEPVMAFNIFESLDMLEASVRTLTERCIRGITVNIEHCQALIEGSIGVVTALVPVLGYEGASDVAKEALATGKAVRKIVLDRGLIEEEKLNELLSPRAMTQPRSMR